MIDPKKLYAARFIPMPELCAGYLRYQAMRADLMEDARRKGEAITVTDVDDIADAMIEGANAKMSCRSLEAADGSGMGVKELKL